MHPADTPLPTAHSQRRFLLASTSVGALALDHLGWASP
jgi:hypothetical protein